MLAAKNVGLPSTSRRHQRVLARPALDPGEQQEARCGQDEQAEDQRAGPAEVDPEVERQQQGQQADREREHAGVVDPLVVRVDGDARHDPPDDRDREDRDRQVEEEDPAPAQRIGEAAAEQGAHGVAEAGRAEHEGAGERRPARGRQRIGHAQDRRPHQGAADAHGAARREQHPGIGRKAAERRERREDGRADEEDVPPAEHVGEPSAGHDQDAEHQGVAGDDPLHRGDVGAEALLDRRQGDRKGCKIVGDDQHGERHGAQPHDLRRAQRVRLRRPLSLGQITIPATCSPRRPRTARRPAARSTDPTSGV